MLVIIGYFQMNPQIAHQIWNTARTELAFFEVMVNVYLVYDGDHRCCLLGYFQPLDQSRAYHHLKSSKNRSHLKNILKNITTNQEFIRNLTVCETMMVELRLTSPFPVKIIQHYFLIIFIMKQLTNCNCYLHLANASNALLNTLLPPQRSLTLEL